MAIFLPNDIERNVFQLYFQKYEVQRTCTAAIYHQFRTETITYNQSNKTKTYIFQERIKK